MCFYLFERLSTEGRGFSEVVIYKENIKAIMTHLLNKCDLPVLVNVSIGLRNVDYYPYPIPDLFYGQPLVRFHILLRIFFFRLGLFLFSKIQIFHERENPT